MFELENKNDFFTENSDAATGNSEAAAETPETPAQPGSQVNFSEVRQADPVPETPRRRRRGGRILGWIIAICIVAIGITVYLRYFNPYAVESKVTGYVTNVERRGIIFKTYEGEMITQSNLTDTTRVYQRTFTFTIPDQSIARKLQSMQGTGRPVTLIYSRYYGVLPWRGASTNVVDAID